MSQSNLCRSSCRVRFSMALMLWSAGCISGCGWNVTGSDQRSQSDAAADSGADLTHPVPDCGSRQAHLGADADGGIPSAANRQPPSNLTLLTWNLEWFGDASEGPVDDAQQYRAVRDVLASEGASLVALEEVASEAAFERMLADLPGYAGILSGYDWTQKTALLWDPTLFEVLHARAISGLEDAGRPPLEVKLRRRWDDGELLVVVVHAKAQADATSRSMRALLAKGIKAHLDAAHANESLVVLGDFNDLMIGSLVAGEDSPYRPFLDDPAYAEPTRALNEPGAVETSYAHGATVDHMIVSQALAPLVQASSLNVLRDELLERYPSFTQTVSDHFPVTLSLDWTRSR